MVTYHQCDACKECFSEEIIRSCDICEVYTCDSCVDDGYAERIHAAQYHKVCKRREKFSEEIKREVRAELLEQTMPSESSSSSDDDNDDDEDNDDEDDDDEDHKVQYCSACVSVNPVDSVKQADVVAHLLHKEKLSFFQVQDQVFRTRMAIQVKAEMRLLYNAASSKPKKRQEAEAEAEADGAASKRCKVAE